MSTLYSELEKLRDRHRKLIQLMEQADVVRPSRELRDTVIGAFRSLEPFAYKPKLVGILKGKHGEDEIWVSRWVHARTGSYGTRWAVGDDTFITLIRKLGDKMVDKVRKPVRSYFEDLVKLTKKLSPYPKAKIFADVSIALRIFRNHYHKAFTWEPIHVTKIEINNYNPWVLLRQPNGPKMELHVYDLQAALSLEPIMDKVIGMYSHLAKMTEKIRKVNKPTLAKIPEVVKPVQVLKRLT